MINILENPLTEEYIELKKHILSPSFPMYWIGTTTRNITRLTEESGTPEYTLITEDEDIPFFSHSILRRPLHDNGSDAGDILPPIAIDSPIFNRTIEVFNQIFRHNGMGNPTYCRMNINMMVPSWPGLQRKSPSHIDHPYTHGNMLVYLNEFKGGHTWVGGVEGPQPMEDMVVSFDGVEHQASSPIDNRRMILLATYAY